MGYLRSVSLHMLTNGGNTEGLFRAAFMQSGFPLPVSGFLCHVSGLSPPHKVGDITNGQPSYDAIVRGTGCASAPDTLACLRAADYKTLLRLMNDSPNIFSYQVGFIILPFLKLTGRNSRCIWSGSRELTVYS